MNINCLKCGKDFASPPSRKGKYCSLECYFASRTQRVEKKCRVCGDKFLKTPLQIAKWGGKYCSIKCARSAKENKIKRICLVCGKTFTTSPSRIKKGWGKYCSRKCSSKSEIIRVDKKCLFCGKKFKVIPSQPGRYCSRKCNSLSQSTKITKKCSVCGKDFKAFPSQVKSGRGKFCSRKCVAIFLNSRGQNKETNIEKKTSQILKNLGVVFESQKKLEGICVADFFVPPDLIIECDGNYWHGSRKAKDKDANKDVLLGFKGYRTLRLTETEINKHPIICRNKIKKKLAEGLIFEAYRKGVAR